MISQPISVALVRLDELPTSPSGAIGAAAAAELIDAGGRVRTVDVARLPSIALDSALESEAVSRALAAISSADVILLAWSGQYARGVELFRSLVDRLPDGALRGRGGVAIAVGPTPADSLRAELRLQGLLRSFGVIAAASDEFDVATTVPGAAGRFSSIAPDAAMIA